MQFGDASDIKCNQNAHVGTCIDSVGGGDDSLAHTCRHNCAVMRERRAVAMDTYNANTKHRPAVNLY